jgi:hypothetical protein
VQTIRPGDGEWVGRADGALAWTSPIYVKPKE